jgi:DNA primase
METTKAWVDFNLIKAAVTMEMLIVQYGITSLARNGDEMRGVCPIHQGKSKREFSINLVKNTFYCFAPLCKARGNVLDFVARMERCTVKDAALKLDDWFNVTGQEIGESETLDARIPQASDADSAMTLIEEIETQLAALKQLVLAR